MDPFVLHAAAGASSVSKLGSFHHSRLFIQPLLLGVV
jgi:hypothetical protein